MKTFMRVIPFLLVLGIVFGGIFLIYNYFSNKNNSNAKILIISKDGKFSNSELKIANSDKLKIRNNSTTNQTVKIEGANQTLFEIDSEGSSKVIELDDNTKNVLYLASDTKQKSAITVGEPKSATTKTITPPAANKATAGAVKAAGDSNEPLPNTGPGELIVYPILALIGFMLLKFSNKFWRFLVR